MEKQIKEVFPDYAESEAIINGTILKINLYKKSNKLEIIIKSKVYIELKEIYRFEMYLKNRFQIETVNINLKYEENVNIPKLEEQWKEIIAYIGKKYPTTKMLLKNSNLEIKEHKISVILLSHGADFLIKRGFETALENLIYRIREEKYKIEYIEKIDEEYVKKYEKSARLAEKLAVELAQQEAQAALDAENEFDNTASKTKEPKENTNINKDNITKPKEKEEKNSKKQENTLATNQNKIEPEEKTPLILGRSLTIRDGLVKVADLTIDSGKISLEGEILNTDSRELKSGKFLVMYDLYDGSSTITCKSFVEAEKVKQVLSRLKEAKGVKVAGTAQFDPFSKELGVIVNVIIETEGRKKTIRMDNSEVKRVELHMHTQMSQMDGMTSAKDLIKRAMKWGMKSIAITDHGVVQAFPEAHKLLGVDNPDMKVIYGVEAYLVPDKNPSVTNSKNQDIDTEYCVFDLETTGLSYRTEKITEIGAIKIKNGEIIDTFETFVNPQKPIPYEVVKVTNITDDMVKDAPTIEQILPKFLEFIGDSVLVAHNADFDIGFTKYNAEKLGYTLNNTYIDTLRLAKEIFPDYKKYKLGIIAEKLGIKVEVAHRALDDVKTLVQVFNVMIEKLKEKNITTLDDFDKISDGEINLKNLPSYHAIILAKDYVGLKNLYKLVSISHLHYFYRKPRILKSLLQKYSEGLILGSACEQGELYRAIVAGKPEEEIEEIARFYDYL